MIVVKTTAEVCRRLAQWRAAGTDVALVPTMGNLHRGHLELLKTAVRHADKVVVSIFVNPLQFDRKDDLAAYPRTPDADLELLRAHGTTLAFTPDYEEMYPPQGKDERVDPGEIGTILCGTDRPDHFAGVATVVVKLFRLFMPDVAVFGEKDYQQLLLIRQLVERFGFDVRIVAVPTVRENNGLALSSRNHHLSEAQKQRAATLYLALRELADTFRQAADEARGGDRIAVAYRRLREAGLQPDYIEVCDAHTLETIIDRTDRGKAEWRVLAAARVGEVRLIDNVKVR